MPRAPIPICKFGPIWVAIVLGLVLSVSGVLHVDGAYAAHDGVSLPTIGSDDMGPVSGPCEDDIVNDVDPGCALAAGCVSFTADRHIAVFPPAVSGVTLRIETHARRGIAALPLARPPKLTVQV